MMAQISGPLILLLGIANLCWAGHVHGRTSFTDDDRMAEVLSLILGMMFVFGGVYLCGQAMFA